MPRAQCYYEILGIEETASGDEIKRAYKNLALLWHPDKNQTNLDEAHTKFQAILKAYETLSDSRERDWYDRHKDQILSDGNKNEDIDLCANLFQYYSSSCYANFDDSEDGFYTIYRTVFDTITNEERQAYKSNINLSKNKSSKKESPPDYPSFGYSESLYEDVVRPFYAFWSGFCTNITFDHLDKYNTTEAENRRILRAMEKENNKIKEVARKERNTNIRKLVEFVKKRDRRMKAHKLIVEQQNQLNRQKTAEKQRQQREKIQKESSQYKPTAWDNLDDIEEQLRQLENQYDVSSDKKSRDQQLDLSDKDNVSSPSRIVDNESIDKEADLVGTNQEEEEEEEEVDFFCPACNKDFRSIKAFENHEASKKHRQNVFKLTKLLKDEEKNLNK